MFSITIEEKYSEFLEEYRLGGLVKKYIAPIGLLFDVWQVVIMPCVFSIRTPRRHWFVLIGNILAVIFQMISLVTRNLGLVLVTSKGVLISMIYSIDVLIMFILYYLYSNIIKRKENNNGCFLGLVSMQRCRRVEGKERETRRRGKSDR